MTLNFVFVLQAALLVAVAVLAIVAFRGTKTTLFSLLKWATVCYLIQHLAPFAAGLFFWTRGWNNSGGIAGWWRSWWWFVNQTLDCLFLAIIIAVLVYFIRDKRLATEQA